MDAARDDVLDDDPALALARVELERAVIARAHRAGNHLRECRARQFACVTACADAARALASETTALANDILDSTRDAASACDVVAMRRRAAAAAATRARCEALATRARAMVDRRAA